MKPFSTFRIYPNQWLLPVESDARLCELGFDINPVDFIIWGQRHDLEYTGKVWEQICVACLDRDVDFLEQFPFIGRIYTSRFSVKREHLSVRVKRQVLAAGRCAYCGSTEQLTVDHIKPYSRGGTHDRSNLQCLCWPCNRRKSDREVI